ncbi:uncharacterized protein LOC110984796 [Acanthaster planci]|uniref:Uncharacterized protein LOC110984796 n=1 Tax=Acanthaster planci TaxID=133434 RepID=A0A8B7Z7S2_ACAPL|nr:uncharacterized protein LOC110984796 [Acanthaster planci]
MEEGTPVLSSSVSFLAGYVTKRSRLCSRHFDKDDIDMYGNVKCDPKYFEWNNWDSQPKKRTTCALQKQDQGLHDTSGTRTSGDHEVAPCLDHDLQFQEKVSTSSRITRPDMPDIGSMEPLCCIEIPQPMDHDYLHTSLPTMIDRCVQTVMTMEDLDELEHQAKSIHEHQPLPGQDVVDCATESDERVNFYTGLTSKSLLQGVYDSISGGVNRLRYWRSTSTKMGTPDNEQGWKRRPGRQHQLPPFVQFVMTLIRLRLNLPLLLLADLFHICGQEMYQTST